MENQKRAITVEEVVAMAKDKLMCIAVPAGLSRQIGLPIEDAIGMLQKVQDAWMRDDLEAKAKAELEKKPTPLFPVEADKAASSEEEAADPDPEPATEEAEENADHGE